MTDLTFTAENHEYRFKGRVVPSVTQVLTPLTKLWTNGADLERARAEGVAIHRTVELDLKGELDEETLPEWLKPYLAAWRKFVADTGFQLRASERMLFSETWGFAGTCDLDGVLTKLKGSPAAVIDVKRTLGGNVIGMQLAGYEKLLIEGTALSGRRRRFGLQLKPLKFVEYTDPRDWTDFLTCLAWARLQQRMREK